MKTLIRSLGLLSFQRSRLYFSYIFCDLPRILLPITYIFVRHKVIVSLYPRNILLKFSFNSSISNIDEKPSQIYLKFSARCELFDQIYIWFMQQAGHEKFSLSFQHEFDELLPHTKSHYEYVISCCPSAQQ